MKKSNVDPEKVQKHKAVQERKLDKVQVVKKDLFGKAKNKK